MKMLTTTEEMGTWPLRQKAPWILKRRSRHGETGVGSLGGSSLLTMGPEGGAAKRQEHVTRPPVGCSALMRPFCTPFTAPRIQFALSWSLSSSEGAHHVGDVEMQVTLLFPPDLDYH